MTPHYKGKKNPAKHSLFWKTFVQSIKSKNKCVQCVSQVLHVHIGNQKMLVRNHCRNTNIAYVKLRQRNNSISFSILDLHTLKIGILFPEHISVSQGQTRLMLMHKQQNNQIPSEHIKTVQTPLPTAVLPQLLRLVCINTTSLSSGDAQGNKRN